MTAVAQISTPFDPDEQISPLLVTALSGITSALSDGLSKLIRAELKKHSDGAAVESAVKNALPGLLERSFQDSLLAVTAETRDRRIAMLHLLTTAEVQSLNGNFLFSASAARTEISESLTTEEAATLLGVSRTHVISLIKSHALTASQTSGGHRRLSKAGVLAYKTEMKTRQSKGLDAMMAATTDMGLYETELEGIPRRAKRKKA